MKIRYRFAVGLTGALLMLVNSVGVADSPESLKSPDRHSIEAKGRVSLYRVQMEGMNIGSGKEKANAEVYVTLDKNPDTVYTLSIKKGAPESNHVMANTLRDAYINKLPVTLYYQMSMGRKNYFPILMVQLN